MFGATLAACVVAAPTAALAATTLQVDAGYGRTFVPGRPVPVRVRVAADRLLAGNLEVSAGGPPVSVAVEVPGGSEKTFLVVVPTPSRSAAVAVSARLPDGSKAPPVATMQLDPLADDEVVGLLPGALGGRGVPAAAPLSVDVGTARFVALGAADLERAPDSLYALRTIGAGADELSRLPAAARNGILRWVEMGGRLLVDAAPGAPVAGLPEGFQPGAGGRSRVGAGGVTLTRGAMAAGRWSGLVEPTSRFAGNNVDGFVGFGGFGGPPLADSLARDAGFRLPRLSWLVGFLAFYVLVVGPGLYVFLRRRRRPELAWAVIPVVAILFTGASYAGGRGLRNDTQVVHGSVVATGSTGSTALTYVGVSTRAGATLRVGYPAGWLAGGGDTAVPATAVRLTASGVETRLPLDAGQFAVTAGEGPSGSTGAISVTAMSAADGEAHGTVRNGTDIHFDGVAVFVGSSVAAVGALEPGDEQDWSMQVFQGVGRGPEFQLFGSNPRTGEPNWTNLALLDAAERSGLVARNPGRAVAVGWTTGYKPPVRVAGRSSGPRGKTLVVGSAPITSTGPRTADVSIARDLVRTGNPSVFRFTMPEGRTVDPAKLVVSSTLFPLEVWTGESWSNVTCDAAACQPSSGDSGPLFVECKPGVPCPVPLRPPVPMTRPGFIGPQGAGGEVALPAGALRDGLVYARYANGMPFAADGPLQMSIREKA